MCHGNSTSLHMLFSTCLNKSVGRSFDTCFVGGVSLLSPDGNFCQDALPQLPKTSEQRKMKCKPYMWVEQEKTCKKTNLQTEKVNAKGNVHTHVHVHSPAQINVKNKIKLQTQRATCNTFWHHISPVRLPDRHPVPSRRRQDTASMGLKPYGQCIRRLPSVPFVRRPAVHPPINLTMWHSNGWSETD